MAPKITHLLSTLALFFLCSYTNSCLASRALLPDMENPSAAIQFGVDPPSLLKPTFPAPGTTQTPPFSSLLPTLPSLQLPLMTPPPPSPSSPFPASPSPPANPVLAHFPPMTFPFPRLLPLPKFPPFPFIPTMPSAPSLPTVPSGFVSSPNEGGEEGSP
ncbi:protein binding protein, putative [Ricinus communis]|uniref:Protein binding protein, putative n=1 Tax=Ricinus communis TaxID=3988 RepID=B9SV67_RICCO|nr:protein binding protein, putative [Ricinus communis]